MTLDDVVPHPQYRMCHSRVVDAPPTAVWDEGTLQLTPEVHPLREGPAAFTRVATGRASGRKLLLIP